MAGIHLLHPQSAQALQRLDVVADIARPQDAGEGPAGQHGVPGKQEFVVRLVNADAAGTVTRGVQNPQAVIAQVQDGVRFQPDVGAKMPGPFVQVLAHGDEFILEPQVVGRHGMGGDHGPLVKKVTGADMIEVFVGQNNQVNVLGRQAYFGQTVL